MHVPLPAIKIGHVPGFFVNIKLCYDGFEMKHSSGWLFALPMLLCAYQAPALEQECREEICYHQPRRTVTFLLHEGCTVGGSLQACMDAVQSAMDSWNAPDCSDMEILLGGTTPRVDIGYSEENPDDNINLIYVLDSGWNHAPTNPRVATKSFDPNSGAIVDFDVEVNNQYFTLSGVDLHNLLARDLGIALGFDKDSGGPDSVMLASSSPQKKILSPGDTQALCQLYPLPGPQPLPSGCSCGALHRPGSSPGSAPSPGFEWMVPILWLVSTARRRGRRSRRDRSPGGRIHRPKTR
jgi:hypothetical protein